MNCSEQDFKKFPKIARYWRDCVITEKIDGTNGVIYIDDLGNFKVGSKSRWLSAPGDKPNDNHGFAAWAYANEHELLKLGQGYHYGEFWGNGIQRGYGLPKNERRFSLFNTVKWSDPVNRPSCCYVVPILFTGLHCDIAIYDCLDELRKNGSKAAPFMNPEGIVIHHSASNVLFKVTLENDEKSKGDTEK